MFTQPPFLWSPAQIDLLEPSAFLHQKRVRRAIISREFLDGIYEPVIAMTGCAAESVSLMGLKGPIRLSGLLLLAQEELAGTSVPFTALGGSKTFIQLDGEVATSVALTARRDEALALAGQVAASEILNGVLQMSIALKGELEISIALAGTVERAEGC